MKYSKFSHSLDKIFRGQSLEDLEQKIKNRIYFRDKDSDFIDKENELKYFNLRKKNSKVLPSIQINNTNEKYLNRDKLKKMTEIKKNDKTNKLILKMNKENKKNIE